MLKMNKWNVNSNLLLLLICLFVVMMGYGVLLPVLPFFLERIISYPIDPENIVFHFGVLTAIYPIILVFTAPLWGRISDRIGSKWPIVIGLGGFTLMQVMIAFSTSLTMLYVARIVGSLFSSFLVPVINAFISDITDEANRTKAMAWAGTAVSAGVVTGPAISGLLIGNNWHLRWEPSFHLLIDRFSVPFIILAIIGFLTLILTLVFLKNNKKTHLNQTVTSFGALFPKGKWIIFGKLLLLSSILQLGITSFETVFPLYVKDSGKYSAAFIGAGLLICGLVMAIMQPIVAKYGKLFIANPEKQMAFGFLIAGLTLPVFVLIQTQWIILLNIGVFGLGSSLIVPNLLAQISLKEPKSSGWALGMQSSFSGIGQIIGPIAGTVLYILGPYSPFYIISGLLVITSIIVFKTLYENSTNTISSINDIEI